jgi:hypothetical protein
MWRTRRTETIGPGMVFGEQNVLSGEATPFFFFLIPLEPRVQ